VKIYDREGNMIEVQDWQGHPLNESIRSARVLEKATGQFRLTPFLFWAAWGAVIVGWISTLVLFALTMVFWAGAHFAAWGFLGGAVVTGIASFFGSVGLAEYYKKHGVPLKSRSKPVELYCKACEKKIEEDLEVANEQRRAELLIELDALGGPPLPALEAPAEVEEDLDTGRDAKGNWRPPRTDPFDRKGR